jgi:peptidoglycan hydrolase CwlO-like protein
VAEKEALDQEAAVIEKQIDNTQQQINTYNQLIAEEEVKLADAQAREQEQYEALCSRVRSMEEMGTVSYLAVLFGATDFAICSAVPIISMKL